MSNANESVSVKVSSATYKQLKKLAKTEDRTILAVLDRAVRNYGSEKP